MPESPNWEQCQKMRLDCQHGIFEKMDEQHAAVLGAITSLKESVAGINGERRVEARIETGSHDPVKWSWKEVGAAVTIIITAIVGGVIAIQQMLK
jgi:hypothetical protein